MHELKPRERLAAEKFLATGVAEEGRKAGGYKSGTWITPKIAAYVYERMQEQAKDSDTDAERVKRALWRVYDRAMADEPVKSSRGKIEYKYNPTIALNALKMIGDMLNIWQTLPGLPPVGPTSPDRIIDGVSWSRIIERVQAASPRLGATEQPPPE